MKILKIFGIVVGIHVFALILIFANPGCSSTQKSSPLAADPEAKSEGSAMLGAGTSAGGTSVPTEPASGGPMVSFNPNAAATGAPSASNEGRYVPTRPGTPVAGALRSDPVKDVTPATTYTVKSGDNLSTIARRHNITTAQLTAANSLSASASLRPGQKLKIPGRAPTPTGAATGAQTATIAPKATEVAATPTITPVGGPEIVKHTVRSGETLGAIARKYDVKQGDIAVANSIADPKKIKPGMELTIPGWRSPGINSTKSAPKAGTGPAPSGTPSSTPTAEPVPSTSFDPVTPASPAVPVIRIDEASTSLAPKQP